MTEKTKVGSTNITFSEKEIKDAQKEGALEHVKEGAKREMAADTGTTSDLEKAAEQQRFRVAADANTTPLAPLLDLSLDELTRRLTDEKADDLIPFEPAKSLLALERAGKNRTGYVRALCDAIGVKSPIEVTSAGPPYTNDETAVTAL